jgi:hypothetical protein
MAPPSYTPRSLEDLRAEMQGLPEQIYGVYEYIKGLYRWKEEAESRGAPEAALPDLITSARRRAGLMEMRLATLVRLVKAQEEEERKAASRQEAAGGHWARARCVLPCCARRAGALCSAPA